LLVGCALYDIVHRDDLGGVAWCAGVFRPCRLCTFNLLSMLMFVHRDNPGGVAWCTSVFRLLVVLHVMIIRAPRQPVAVSHGAQVHSALWQVMRFRYSAFWSVLPYYSYRIPHKFAVNDESGLDGKLETLASSLTGILVTLALPVDFRRYTVI